MSQGVTKHHSGFLGQQVSRNIIWNVPMSNPWEQITTDGNGTSETGKP